MTNTQEGDSPTPSPHYSLVAVPLLTTHWWLSESPRSGPSELPLHLHQHGHQHLPHGGREDLVRLLHDVRLRCTQRTRGGRVKSVKAQLLPMTQKQDVWLCPHATIT